MKKVLAICGLALGLLVLYPAAASAQNPYGGNNPNGLPAWYQAVQNGVVSPVLAMLAIREVTPFFQTQSGLGFLQLLQRYQVGQLSITVIPGDPVAGTQPSLRIAYGGGIAIISITDVM